MTDLVYRHGDKAYDTMTRDLYTEARDLHMKHVAVLEIAKEKLVALQTRIEVQPPDDEVSDAAPVGPVPRHTFVAEPEPVHLEQQARQVLRIKACPLEKGMPFG